MGEGSPAERSGGLVAPSCEQIIGGGAMLMSSNSAWFSGENSMRSRSAFALRDAMRERRVGLGDGVRVSWAGSPARATRCERAEQVLRAAV